MTIYIVRASHANEYELQNYAPLSKELDLKVITSLHPMTPLSLPTLALWSPTDLPRFPLRRQFLNRLIGGEQWLLGLEQLVKPDDILHTAETYTPYTHQAVQLRRARKIKRLICTTWETIPHNNEKLPRLLHWKQDAYRYVDLFHAPTIRAQQALIKEGVAPRKIKVIPYGIDRSRFRPVKKRSSTRLQVLTLARPVGDKGVTLARSLSQRLCALADFRWVTGVPYADVPALYQQADIFFLPSQQSATWEEQYGMVLLEAMASGIPLVTTTSGAIPEIVGTAALLSAPSDLQGMERDLLALITDAKLRARYHQRSLSRSKYFDHLRLSRQLRTLFTAAR